MNESEMSLIFRFDGLDAEDHKIELYALGESMQGLARIASVAAHFASSQKYTRYLPSHSFRLLAKEPKANCFTMAVVLEFLQQHQILSGSFSALISLIANWILVKNSNKQEKITEMQTALLQALKDYGVQRDQQLMNLIGILELMASEMKGASRLAVSPIGSTVTTLTVSSGDGSYQGTYDISDAEKIREKGLDELTGIELITIKISELDTERKTAKVYIEEIPESSRISVEISDPLLMQKNNPYAISLASKMNIRVKAKLKFTDGKLSRAYISDVEM